MSAKKFIAELDRRKVLPDRLMGKLRDSVATIRRPLSADELADFLVQKQLLTREQANDVLAGLSLSGIDLGKEDDDVPLTSGAGESSSVFASHIFSHPNPDPPVPREEDEELRLIPLEEDAAIPQQTSDVMLDDDVPLLGQVEDPEAVSLPEPEVVERGRGRRLLVTEEPQDQSLIEQELRAGTATGGVAAAGGGGAAPAAVRRLTDKKKKGRPSKSKKQWDSPLILIGGGALAFLLLAGGTIWFLLNWESGDQKLAQAREAMNGGAYPQAIAGFEEFLESSPRHAEHSTARIQLAMLRVRQAAEANDFAQALEIAQTELKAIEDEPAFETARPDIADLVPKIAEGLAKQAEQAAPLSDESMKFVGLANKAIELWNNTSYLPKEMRDEARLTNVRDSLERVARRQQSQLALAEGLKAIEQALGENKPVAAFAAFSKLLTEHPELAGEKGLGEAIKKTSAAELAAIKYVAEAKPAETADHPTPWVAALAVANRKLESATPVATGVACVRVDGAVYGIEAGTGKVLWRRYVGYATNDWPITIDNDVVLTDTARRELLRLDATTGRLIWRQAIGEPFAKPLLVGDRGYVPSDSGKLLLLDLKSGAQVGYLQTTQPLRVQPSIDRTKTHLYVVGDRASVYSITLPDMKCIGSYFLGHSPGTVQVAPAMVMDKLAVVENNGVETSRLHLLTVDKAGAVARQQAERHLTGLVTSPLQTTGRGLIVVTDRGQIEVYDIAAGNEGNALTPIASREANSSQPITRHVTVTGRNVWLADTQLTKFNIVPTGNRLPTEEIENNFVGAAFDHPLAAFGDVLIEVHRPKGQPGAMVEALNTKQGHALWQTELAMPPAGAPVVDDAAKSLTVANAAGHAFRFDEAAIRTRVQDKPLAAELAPPQAPALSTSVDLGQGRAVFCAAQSEWMLTSQPGSSGAAKWIKLDSPLACAPTRMDRGLLTPTEIGQVFFLSSVDGSRLAAPFQPLVDPKAAIAYKPAGVVSANGKQFVITDGGKRIFLVGLVEAPQPHLDAVKEADVGPRPIISPVVVVGDVAIAAAAEGRLLKFRLPGLESGGEANLSAPVQWGPYAAGDVALLATADHKLLAIPATADARWQAVLEHDDLAGPPLVVGNSVLLAYRKGIVERRALADGKVAATKNVEQPLATGPAVFLQKLVLAGNDGTVLVIDQP